jgi:hypothetical protein
VILEGMITTFWINTMVKAQSRVEVASLRDADSGDGLWATSIYGHGEGILWTGASSEFEVCIQAVDEALNQLRSICIGCFLQVKKQPHRLRHTIH